MSICTDCYDAGAFVDLCAEGLIFAEVDASTEYTIALQSTSTGKIQAFTATSDENGNITLEGAKLSPNTNYELWVTQGNVNDTPVSITIDGVDYTCITFTVVSTGQEPELVELTPIIE